MPVATANHFKGVAGLLLALPFSFSPAARAQGGEAGGYALLQQAMLAEHTQSAWLEYARSRIVPDFDWAERPAAQAPDMMSLAFAGSSRARFGNGRLGLSLESSRESLGDLGRGGRGAFAPMKLKEIGGLGLRQEIFSPGVVAQTRFGQLEVGAVFAYQRYASWDLGSFSGSDANLGILSESRGRVESSFGQGVRLGMAGDLGENWGYRFDYRSRVDMDAFHTYLGVYSEPGRFDLPSTVSATFDYRLAPRTTVAVGVEQVRYSEVRPFLSPNLPNRFLALLGDGASPEFRWRDLTIYTAEWRWQPTGNDGFVLRYSTRQQPTPTSPALRRALEDDFTHHNYAFAYVRRLAPNMQLGFSASYAPATYFLGQIDPFLRPYRTGEQIEAELLLTARF